MTIEDIAREANVSVSTVSRVMNGKHVKDKNRDAVQETISRFGYVPNMHARALMNKSSCSVGIIVTAMTNAYHQEIAEAAEGYLRERNFRLFLSSVSGSNELERSYLSDLQSRRFDGAIVVDACLENWENGFYTRIAEEMPLVLVHSIDEITSLDSIYIDQKKGALCAFEELYKIGRRNIVILRGKEGFSYDIKEAAFKDFLAAHNLSEEANPVIRIEDGNTEAAIGLSDTALSLLIAKNTKFDAVFGANDLMASGALRALLRNGIKVPEQVSVIGHDDTALAMSTAVRLSSIDLKMHTVGLKAAELLIDRINARLDDQNPDAKRIVIVPELQIRESS